MSKQIDGSSPASLVLKTKLQAMRDDLEAYKELFNSSSKKREVEIEKGLQMQSEVDSLRAKVKEMNDEYAELTENINTSTEKLTIVTKHADECERGRRALDHRRNMDLDRIALFEQMIKDATENLRESEKNSEEVSRKLTVLQKEEERILKKNEALEASSVENISQLKIITSQMKACQLQIEKFAEREEIYEKTIADIQARIAATNAHNKQLDDLISKLKSAISSIKNEIANTSGPLTESQKDLIKV